MGVYEIIETVKPPAALAEKPYLQPTYDEPEFIVRNVWRRYGGWWPGIPRRPAAAPAPPPPPPPPIPEPPPPVPEPPPA